MYYHATNIAGIKELRPSVSMHDKSLVYMTTKRENALVYLSNAVEKYCKEIGFEHSGKYRKWCSYGFTKDGILELQEYWPGAVVDTYAGVSGYVYVAQETVAVENMKDISCAVTSTTPVPVESCEYVPDAYVALKEAEEQGLIRIKKYSENSKEMLAWIERCIKEQYKMAQDIPEYKVFLEGKFGDVLLKNIALNER